MDGTWQKKGERTSGVSAPGYPPSRSGGLLRLAGERKDEATLFPSPRPRLGPPPLPAALRRLGRGEAPSWAGTALPFVVRAGRRGWGLQEREGGVGS